MTVPRRRTLWKQKGDAPYSKSAPDSMLRMLYADAQTTQSEPNPLASAAVKVSLAAALGIFATMSPTGFAAGSEASLVALVKAADDAEGPSAYDDEANAIEVSKPSGVKDAASSAGSDNDGPESEAVSSPNGSSLESDVDASEALEDGDALPALEGLDSDEAGFEALSLDELESDEDDIALMATTQSVGSQAAFESAITSMDAQGTITLSASFTISTPLSIPSNANLTIKLNGQTLTGSASSVFDVAGGASLTLSGPGTIIDSLDNSHVLSATSPVGSLRIDASATLRSDGTVFNNVSWFPATSIAPGCSLSDYYSILPYYDDVNEQILYTHGLYKLMRWADPDAEQWYAKVMFVYCQTEADYEELAHHFDTTDVEFPSIEHTVTFKTMNPEVVVKKDVVYQGHCIGSKACGNKGMPPTNEQMLALAPSGTTFEGWLDSKGKLYTIEDICGLPVMNDTVYTAKFKEVPVDPDPIPPNPVDPTPVGPVNPVDPKPWVPNPNDPNVTQTSGGGTVDVPANRGSGSGGRSSSHNRIPFPETPWNPPGLALAAGFTVPENGPGVEIREDIPESETAGAGPGDGFDGEDGIWLSSSEEQNGGILPFTAADVVVRTAALGGGVALTAVIASNVSSFFAANAQVAAQVRPRKLGKGKRIKMPKLKK